MRSTDTPSDLNRRLLGRMSPLERVAGRFLRGPEGHVDAPAADAVEEITGGDDPVVPAAGDAAAEDVSILADAASPGDGVAKDETPAEGAADEAEAASDDGANAEAAPYEGITAPEGYEAIDTEALAAATPLMRQFGVPDDQAQAFIDGAAPIITSMVEKGIAAANAAQVAAQVTEQRAWVEEVRADPEIGGANYDRTVALSAKALDQFFPGERGTEFRDFLRATGLTNHPEMIRGFASIGAAISDGSIHIGDSTREVKLTPAEKLYPAFVPKQD